MALEDALVKIAVPSHRPTNHALAAVVYIPAHIGRERFWVPQELWVALLVLATSALLCVSITHQSLWIDEAVMAYFASYNGLTSMFVTLSQQRTSDPQMPFYVLYLWGWARIFGTSEYALRAANIPFAAVLCAAMAWTSWRVFGRPMLWVVFCLSPFVWFYMNEARPYIGIMAGAAVSTGALIAYFSGRDRYGKIAPWVCLSALWFACALQMLSAFLLPSLIVLVILSKKEQNLTWEPILRDWRPALLVHAPFFFSLAAYYSWTLSVGAGGMREAPGLGNLAFASYEFMGFAGLGPPRDVLRGQQHLQGFISYWPWLSVGVVAATSVLAICMFQMVRQQQRHMRSLALGLSTGIILFVLAAEAAQFRFWGRHLAVFFPLFCFVLMSALGGIQISKSGKVLGRVTVFLLLCAWLISDARLWALPHYQKDDYRFAANAALDAASHSNAIILWAANGVAARYYGLEFEDPLERVQWPVFGRAILAANWSEQKITEYLNTAQAPVVVVLSTKTDLYDAAENWVAAVHTLEPIKIASPNTFNIYLFATSRTGKRLSS